MQEVQFFKSNHPTFLDKHLLNIKENEYVLLDKLKKESFSPQSPSSPITPSTSIKGFQKFIVEKIEEMERTNVFKNGYFEPRGYDISIRNANLKNVNINENVTHMKYLSTAWFNFYKLIGKPIFTFLLNSVILEILNYEKRERWYIQICGDPINFALKEVKFSPIGNFPIFKNQIQVNEESEEQPRRKIKQKIKKKVVEPFQDPVLIGNIQINNNYLYSNSYSTGLVQGFRKNHRLNKLDLSAFDASRTKFNKKKFKNFLSKEQQLKKIFQNKSFIEIFKKVFNYEPVFLSHPDQDLMKFFIELKINQKETKKFRSLLVYYCKKEQILPFDNENRNSILISTQNTIQENDSFRLSQGKQKVTNELKNYVPHNTVFIFIYECTQILLPNNFWGSKDNQNVFKKHLEEFIKRGKNEKVFLENLIKGIKVSDFSWIRKSQNNTLSERIKTVIKTNIIRRLVVFIFEQIVTPLLRIHFYVTESDKNRYSLFFYKKGVWRKLIRSSKKSYFANNKFKKLKGNEERKFRQEMKTKFQFPYFGKIRFLPKQSSVRGIVNLGYLIEKDYGSFKTKVSVNKKLRDVHSIIKYEKQKRPEIFGSAIFNHFDLYTKLLNLRKNMEMERRPRKLYFVKVDVKGAYDNIQHGKLLNSLSNLFSQSYYHSKEYLSVSSNYDSFLTQNLIIGGSVNTNGIRNDPRIKEKIGEEKKSTILIDKNRQKSLSIEEIMEKIRFHITKNVITYEGESFLQLTGIPQGSVLSPLLCAYFYAEFERNKLANLPGTVCKRDPFSSLIRMVDDFLYISANKANAIEFLEKMCNGCKEYGISINETKTETNFNHSFVAKGKQFSVEAKRHLYFIGVKIDSETLEVFQDYARLHECNLREKTICNFRQPGRALIRKLKFTIVYRITPVMIDHLLNSKSAILLNILQAMILSAMKFHVLSYYSHFKDVDDQFYKIFIDFMGFIFIHLCKTNQKIINNQSKPLFFDKDIILYLGTYAFLKVLYRKSTYDIFFKNLSSEFSRVEFFLKKKLSSEEMKELHEIMNEERSSEVFSINY